MKIYVLDVGQGQCTFAAIYNTSNTKIVETLLFDCGSDKKSDDTEINLDAVAAMILTMDTPAIDCIVFSHSDKDHISLTYYLLEQISKTTKPIVKNVWFGGSWANYTKYSFNILDYLVSGGFCGLGDINTTNADYTSYDKSSDSYSTHFWTTDTGEIAIFPIASNVVSDDPDWDDDDDIGTQKTAEERNRVSIVCGLYYNRTCVVICGDATSKTMAAIGSLMYGTSKFDDNMMTTLPHHGSRATGFAVKSGQVASTENIKIVDTFATVTKSQTITISAYEKHRHPSLELMNRFIPTETTPMIGDPRLNEARSHRVTAYFDVLLTNSSGMKMYQNIVYSFETQINTFSTRYYDGDRTVSYQIGAGKIYPTQGVVSPTTPINGFACWMYEMESNGDTTLAGYSNLNSPEFTDYLPGSSIAAERLKEHVPTVRVRRKDHRPHRAPATENRRHRAMQFQH